MVSVLHFVLAYLVDFRIPDFGDFLRVSPLADAGVAVYNFSRSLADGVHVLFHYKRISKSHELRPGASLFRKMATYLVLIDGFRGYLRSTEGLGYMRVIIDSLYKLQFMKLNFPIYCSILFDQHHGLT